MRRHNEINVAKAKARHSRDLHISECLNNLKPLIAKVHRIHVRSYGKCKSSGLHANHAVDFIVD
jgi:hypothetical protein